MPNINGYASKAAALRELKAQGFSTAGLLAKPESNPKVAKNGKVDVLTAPLHLAPFNLSGFQTCAQASKGCAAACLHTAGNPAYMAGKEASRTAKTRAYFMARDAFMAVLAFEIAAHAAKAAKLGMECGVRLNATSDLPWEHRTVTIDGETVGLIEYFEDVQFYDYTKITKRALKATRNGDNWPDNYHLTFSKTEDNDADVIKVLAAGGNVAVVFAPETLKAASADGMQASQGALVVAGGAMSSDWLVVDGDAHDYRPADPKGCIVALKAKGDAKADRSGFVVR